MENINVLIDHFQRNIYNNIQSSNLPIGIAYFVMKDFLNDLEKNYIATLNHFSLDEQTEEAMSVIVDEKSTNSIENINKKEDNTLIGQE